MALFDQSAMSGAAFARLHGIRYTTLSHWRRMRRRKEEGSTTPHSPVLFHEVVVGSVPQARDGIEVNLPLGARVQLNGPEQIPLVAALARHRDRHVARVAGGRDHGDRPVAWGQAGEQLA